MKLVARYVVPSILLVAACGGSIGAGDAPEPGDARPQDEAGTAAPVDAGDAEALDASQNGATIAVPADAIVVLETSGGWAPTGAAGSNCHEYFQQHRYERATRRLEWSDCEQSPSDAGPMVNRLLGGEVQLTAEAAAAIDASLAQVTVLEDPPCSAGDGPRTTLTVRSPGGEPTTYSPPIYCDASIFVEGLGSVYAAMRAATGR